MVPFSFSALLLCVLISVEQDEYRNYVVVHYKSVVLLNNFPGHASGDGRFATVFLEERLFHDYP